MAYEANGSATGGRIELRDVTGQSEIFLVEPVTGRVRRQS